ncbi:glycosyltransferase [Thalassotalea sp. HSM 43]|uniref:glycosyltransferase n=1 Tax=Thalassotalea sp. HSM 43 TaxID=2552945 RepID=UPI001081C1D3|nr:glycosyltransferase [Thalassotalea sp. HSM 43]QBY03541.1 glycosyltransferase [Thalassotalea sp. HSM 43]
MLESIFSKANEAYNQGDYFKAKNLYEKAGDKYGKDFVRLNIQRCLKNLKQSANHNVKPVTINQTFDHVYMVNLKDKVENRLKVAQHLTSRDIDFEVFEATNGYKGEPLEVFEKYKQKELGTLSMFPEFNDLEVKRGKGFLESAGAVGYIFTYLRIIRDAKANGYKRILIVEDDVLLTENFDIEFSKFMDSTNDQWKVLQFGASQYNWDSVDINDAYNKGYYSPRRLHTCGSFAIGLDHSIFDELIELQEAFEAPFDHISLGALYEKYLGECFVAFPNIIMPDVEDSSIRGGRCQITHGEKMKWEVESFDFPLSKPSVNVLVDDSNALKYLHSFEKPAYQPFELRVFINTEDGPRAIHNLELLDLDFNRLVAVTDNVKLPEADYSLIIESGATLTEDDVTKYIEFSTGVRSVNATPLIPLKAEHQNIVEGRISVIIPTYKRPTNLANALRSAASQEYFDKEILVVSDNGIESSFNEETTKIVNQIKEEFPQVSIQLLIHNMNRNGAAARNTGLNASTGEFICYLDDDDIYLPGRLNKSVEALNALPKTIGGVYGGFLGWNSPVNDDNRYATGDLTKEILTLDYMKHYLHTNTATYRRSAVLAINGFDESYRRHQDLEFNLRYFELYQVGAVNHPMVRMNPEPSDVSNKVFNTGMLTLKAKFLGQFNNTIESFGKDVAEQIYRTHWNEVARYTDNPIEVDNFLNSQYSNGPLQVALHFKNKQ